MRLKALVTILFSFVASPVAAQFVGKLVLEPTGCEKSGTCTLSEGFGFYDSRNVGWEAAKGNVTDGASIPRWAQRFVGVPFTPEYVPASVLHDHYSKSGRPVRGWFETQRMFYEALVESGVPVDRASVLYAGVLIGSGKWITRMKGKPCPNTMYCVQQAVVLELEQSGPTFGTTEYTESFARMMAEIEAGRVVGMEAVEDMARAERPGDIYLHNPSGIIRSNIEFGALATE
ncbi:DUF1353 domain-containing protein [Pseudotabrizicola alkalilacus]|uniref:DUF1353 domain-containing protein n=1 Tax=Pseudotabrizicola alkalilacus TaxID=2305252 RepID=A0A411YZ87_9RHOB|nr:DUF1353 domain-containing protein [Pseudotabrizicola alkalilacus]RGP36122.1 DUF1353 domain-containing protein [Pseudotabrizicola alkalilacus]